MLEGLVREHGRFFRPQPLPKGRGFRRKKSKQCFFNCIQMALDHGLIYVEGFAMSDASPELPLHHAW
jgi:hypothetical protein